MRPAGALKREEIDDEDEALGTNPKARVVRHSNTQSRTTVLGEMLVQHACRIGLSIDISPIEILRKGFWLQICVRQRADDM